MAETKTSSYPLIEEQGQVLVRLARQTIARKLGRQVAEVDESSLAIAPLQAGHGTFVTLHLAGELRGCIGNLTASESVVDGVRRNANNAAFHDPRFAPLTIGELDAVEIEVSILTDPQPLEYEGPEDLLARLRPGIDGVIIKKGFASATFLPQVWEQLPESRDFLAYLCRKAGLASDAWLHADLKVSTYQVQYFSED